MATTSSARLDAVLSGLADPARRSLLELLRERPRSAGELAERLRTSAPTTSRHLRTLLDAGLITDDRPSHDARVRVFRLKREPFAALASWAEEMQAEWDKQLRAFKEHVERGRRR